jgi:uncharacterized repeat protein (TIGR01451 family)
MTRKWLAYCVPGILIAGLGAAAAGPVPAATVIRVNGATGTDAPGCGVAPVAPCKTMQYAYFKRAASGDTIKVAAGTYDMVAPFVIGGTHASRPRPDDVAFDGAKAGVDARSRPAACSPATETVVTTSNLLYPIAAPLMDAETSGITVDGFCFKGSGRLGEAGLQSGRVLAGGARSSGFTVEDNIFTGFSEGLYLGSDGTTATTVRDNLFDADDGADIGAGVYSDFATPLHNAVIERNMFRGDSAYPVLIDQSLTPPGGPGTDITISDNDFPGQGYVALYGVSGSAVTDNTMTGGGGGVGALGKDHDVTISGNTITAEDGNGVTVGNCIGGTGTGNTAITVANNSITHPRGNGVEIFASSDIAIRDNTLLDSGNDGIRIASPAATEANFCGIIPAPGAASAVTITRNTILRPARANSGIDVAADSYTGPMRIHYNRIGYGTSGHGLVDDDPGAPIDARDNWWGCDSMPGGTGCQHLAGTAPVEVCSKVDSQTVCLLFARRSVVDLHVTETAFPRPFAPGAPVTYMLTVRNSGPADADGVTVTDQLPAGLTHVTWTCAAVVASSRCATASGTGPIRTAGTIAAHGSLVYTLTGSLPRGANGHVASTATLTSPSGAVHRRCASGCGVTVTVTWLPAGRWPRKASSRDR